MARVFNLGDVIYGKQRYVIQQGSEESVYLRDGIFALSYKALGDDGKCHLLKVYKEPSPDQSWFKAYCAYQSELMTRLERLNENVILIEETFVDPHEGYIQIIEWVNGQNLQDIRDKASRGPEEIGRRIDLAKVLLFAFDRLHQSGIVHSDQKLENVFAEYDPTLGLKWRVKINDFDWSILLERKPPWQGGPRGTPDYASPEHFQGEWPTTKSDMFTIGVMLFEMLTGHHPYDPLIQEAETIDQARQIMMDACKRGWKPDFDSVNPEVASSIPKAFKEGILACLSWDPGVRPTAKELHSVLISKSASSAPTAASPLSCSPAPVASCPDSAKKKLVLQLNGSSLKWRAVERTIFSRRMCEKFFGMEFPSISSEQAYLEPSEDRTQWYVTHRHGASNATMVDNKPVEGKSALKAGMKLQVGNPQSGSIAIEILIGFEPV